MLFTSTVLFGCLELEPTVTPDGAAISNELTFKNQTELVYATNFEIYNYYGGYKYIHILEDDTAYFVVPENKKAPTDLPKNIQVINLPIQNFLVSSTPTTSLVNALGELDQIKLTTTKLSGWYIPEVIDNMNQKKMLYVGDYKAPDYEMLETNKPTMSVWSTMVTDEVKTKLTEMGIPYMLDYASNENHPLARVEYAKLYGALIGAKEEKINEVFNTQVNYVKAFENVPETGKTVSIFYITSSGKLYVRNNGDYMTKMVYLAGGKYVQPTLGADKTGNSQPTFEDFYVAQKDADFIIYVWTLGGKPKTLADFTAKNPLLSDFKAVKEGNVWITSEDFFQIADTLGYMVDNINKMLNSTAETGDLQYLRRLK